MDMMRTKLVIETVSDQNHATCVTASKTCIYISDQSDHLVEEGLCSWVGLVVVHERVEVELA